jgi:hypothetical protein
MSQPAVISLGDLSNVWMSMPHLLRYVSCFVGGGFFGYIFGVIDYRKPVSVNIRNTITCQPEAEPVPIQTLPSQESIEAAAVLGDSVGKTAMGIELPSPEEIKARQEAISKRMDDRARRKRPTRKKPRTK